jgi:hypothetical protein
MGPQPNTSFPSHTWAGFRLDSSRHLCQYCLYLGPPEAHVHSVVQVDGSGERSTSLLRPSYRATQGAEAAVAVGLEQAHAQLLGQGEARPNLQRNISERLRNLKRALFELERAEIVARKPQGVPHANHTTRQQVWLSESFGEA